MDKFDPGFIKKVYLVDNKSLDKTIQNVILKSKSLNQKITIMCNNENYGMGGSIKNCIENFLSTPSNEFLTTITLKFLIHL